ncbi:MAG: 50S ribosomal protein L17 [Candidatus Dependentiae bacterium]|nr:50S ribosomal protein L17 [Candidatus Dependentiae bacterium]
MEHQKSGRKLNMAEPHRRAVLRNQLITFILHGSLTTTKPRVKELRRLAERLVTIARDGNTFNNRRRVKALLPYKEEAIVKLFKEIAPRYEGRPGGYTRIYLMGRRMSDTADIARLEWV